MQCDRVVLKPDMAQLSVITKLMVLALQNKSKCDFNVRLL